MERATATEPATERLTVVVHRRVKAGREADFERAMRGFVEFALAFPGHVAIRVVRPPPGERDYTVVDEFAGAHARREFVASDAYRRWIEVLGELTDGDPQLTELTGLEAWFPGPRPHTLPRPPAWKMAVATFLGVYPVAMTLEATLAPRLAALPRALAGVVFNGCVVALLTWAVMPLVTRLLQRWLFPGRA